MSYSCKDFGKGQVCDGCEHNPFGLEMPEECGAEWNDGKEHKCIKRKGHVGGHLCSCHHGTMNRAQRRAEAKANRRSK